MGAPRRPSVHTAQKHASSIRALSVARRYDYLRLDASNLRRTPQGGIAVPAALTRTGIFVYRKADGSSRSRWSCARPRRSFRPTRWPRLARGTPTIGYVAQIESGQLVEALGRTCGWRSEAGRAPRHCKEVRIQHGDAVQKEQVESGDLKELSCWIRRRARPDARHVERKERYDAVQLKASPTITSRFCRKARDARALRFRSAPTRPLRCSRTRPTPTTRPLPRRQRSRPPRARTKRPHPGRHADRNSRSSCKRRTTI